ncbi:MAG TPA: NUDIX hydrolase [Candidatus Anoxymicrobiaceae bacterium]|jgi:8-oxo-dGTP pyrophosphatase MutT (NUDIX family)
MYTSDQDIEATERALGEPLVCSMDYEIAPGEFDMVKSSMHSGRAHDVTMFIRNSLDPEEIAVIRKPFFPRGAFRAPSGAAREGESLEDGALRESKEETGLDVSLTRYVVRINARFTSGGRVIDWTSHIFEALAEPGEIDPIDTREITEARWATLAELQGPIRQKLLDTGWDLFRYRVALHDLTVSRMEEAGL